ncbi:HWE histidine kinase domain-containing protein [Microvirga sp. GCM10011540]|uniref:HWE histidine kinase domain-containing protein n=1 Tax=Microvirga sp. GCM10011540 TaxID=3317338 RepID=UPI0036100100
MSLLTRLYLLVVLAAAPAFGLVLYNDWQLRQAAEAQVEANALRYSRLVSGELDRIFAAVRSTLGAAAKAPAVQSLRGEECTQYLSNLAASHPNLSRLGVIRVDGQGACGLNIRVDPAATPSLRAALGTSDSYLGEYTVGRGSSVPILPFAERIEDANGKPVGVVASGLRLDWLGAYFVEKAKEFPPATSITIVDRNGTILVRLPNRDREGTSLSRYPELRAERGGTLRSQAAHTADGVARILGFTAIPEAPEGVGVAVGLSQDVALEPIRQTTRRNLVLIALTAIVAMSAAWLGGRRFLQNPIRSLVDAAERLRAGDLTSRTPLEGKGSELARLGSAFNAMASELAARDEERNKAAQALRDSEERLLIAQDAARIGVWEWDLAANQISWSRQMYELFGLDPESAASDPYGAWLRILHPEDREETDRTTKGHSARPGPFTNEFRIVAPNGAVRWILVRGRTIPGENGTPRRMVGANLDITEIKEQEIRETFLLTLADRIRDVGRPGELLRTVAELLGLHLKVSCVGYSEINEGEVWATVLTAWRPEGVQESRQRYRTDAFGDAFVELKMGRTFVVDDARTDHRTKSAVQVYESIGAIGSITVPLVRDGRLRGFLFVHQATPRRWTPSERELCEEVAERTWSALERVRADARRRLLINELNHRVKNTLATVQSIAAQAFRANDWRPEVREAFEARLIALSKAHDVLTRESWDGADLREIVAQATAPFSSIGHARFTVEGPPVRLSPSVALSLAMTLHELLTNAVKYGALSVAEGRVAIVWSVDETPESVRLKLTWQESGGPAVSEPQQKGFGSRLIERSLTREHGGEVRITYPAPGLACEIVITLPSEGTAPGTAPGHGAGSDTGDVRRIAG